MGILQEVASCIRDHAAAMRQAKTNFGDRVDACKDTLSNDLTQCDALPPSDQLLCRQQAYDKYLQCVESAVAIRNAELQQVDAALRFCLLQSRPS